MTLLPKLKKVNVSGSFSKIAFPTIRKVFPSLIASQVVSVQPMSLPSGLIFHLDYMFGKRRPVKSQDELNRLFKIWELYTNKFPIGSKLPHHYVAMGEKTQYDVTVTSDFYVLSQKNGVAFLCDRSKDETDFYFVDDMENYEETIKELEKK